MQQISQSTKQQSAESADDVAAKVKSLERDLYYYRKTSRDLRKKLQTLTSSERVGVDGGAGLIVEGLKIAVEERVNSAPELEESGKSHGRVRKKRRGPCAEGGSPSTGDLVADSNKMDERMGGIEAAASIFAQKEVGGTAASLQMGKGRTVSSQHVVGGAASRQQVGGAVPSQHQVGGAVPSQHQVSGAVPVVVKRHKTELRQLR